jgi:hypothetical protein
MGVVSLIGWFFMGGFLCYAAADGALTVTENLTTKNQRADGIHLLSQWMADLQFMDVKLASYGALKLAVNR